MFQVVEFDKSSGGGIAIVRDVWLTPRKKETFWPPYKLSNQFHRALMDGQEPDSTWPTYKISRTFYITDNLLKAREKEKLAVEDSDVQTDGGTGERKRKRIPKKNFSFGEEDDDDDDDDDIRHKRRNTGNRKSSIRRRIICDSSEEENVNSDLDISNKDASPALKAKSLIDALPTYISSQDKNVHRQMSLEPCNEVGLSVSQSADLTSSQSQDSHCSKNKNVPRQMSLEPCNEVGLSVSQSADLTSSQSQDSHCSKNKNVHRQMSLEPCNEVGLSVSQSADLTSSQSQDSHCSKNKNVHRQMSLEPCNEVGLSVSQSADLTSSRSQDSHCPKSLEVIAKHLASIEKRLADLYSNQQLLMAHFLPSSGPYPTPGTPVNTVNIGGSLIPNHITLPCKSHEDLEKLETWLEKEDSQKVLEKTLYLRGGKKIKDSVPRMLEVLFSNDFATQCNWTGKNNKRPLKDLKINKIISNAVRRNHLTSTATDFDITTTVRSWFRYTKDRDGGRERRRKEPRGSTVPAPDNQQA